MHFFPTQTLMSVWRVVTGVSKSAITVSAHMPVAVILAIALVKMESLAMVHIVKFRDDRTNAYSHAYF